MRAATYKIWTFTGRVGSQYTATVEYWTDHAMWPFSKTFDTMKARDEWVREKRRTLDLVGPERPRMPAPMAVAAE